MAEKKKPSVESRARHDRAFLKKALANPGLRSKLPADLLPADMRARREMNTRLAAPIVPGSSTTERDLAQAAQAATTVRYGPQESQFAQDLGVSQQTERDTGSFYDQYLADLKAHSANVAAYQAGAQAGLAQTAQGITGLSGAQGAELQQAANQTAVPGVAQAGNMAPMLSDATAVRQALIGSFQAQQALQGASANTFADAQANVVGPGQKLSALMQAAGHTKDVRKQIENLKSEEGAFNQQFRDTRRQDEFKNVLAAQTLNANVANQTADNAIAASNAASNAAARSPEGKAAVTTAQEEAKNAAKLGISVHQYRVLGPAERQRRLKALKATTKGSASDSRYTTGPFAGMLKSDVNALSNSAAQAKVDAYNKKKPTGSTGKGPNWQTNAQQQTFWKQVDSAVAVAKKLGATANMTQAQRRQIAERIMADPKTPGSLPVSVALDKIIGHLSPNNVKRLHDAGYQVKTGGVPTRKQAGISAAEARRRRQRSARTPASNIPGIGSTQPR